MQTTPQQNRKLEHNNVPRKATPEGHRYVKTLRRPYKTSTGHTQTTPKGQPDANDTPDKRRNAKRTECKMHIQHLDVIRKKQPKNPRHKQATPHRAPA